MATLKADAIHRHPVTTKIDGVATIVYCSNEEIRSVRMQRVDPSMTFSLSILQPTNERRQTQAQLVEGHHHTPVREAGREQDPRGVPATEHGATALPEVSPAQVRNFQKATFVPYHLFAEDEAIDGMASYHFAENRMAVSVLMSDGTTKMLGTVDLLPLSPDWTKEQCIPIARAMVRQYMLKSCASNLGVWMRQHYHL